MRTCLIVIWAARVSVIDKKESELDALDAIICFRSNRILIAFDLEMLIWFRELLDPDLKLNDIVVVNPAIGFSLLACNRTNSSANYRTIPQGLTPHQQHSAHHKAEQRKTSLMLSRNFTEGSLKEIK